jgi:hypothetical protein
MVSTFWGIGIQNNPVGLLWALILAAIVILVVKKLADMKGIVLRTFHLLLIFVFVFLLFLIIL